MMNHAMTAGQWLALNDESCHDCWSMASNDESCHDHLSMASNDESCHDCWSMASSNDPCSVRGEIPCAALKYP